MQIFYQIILIKLFSNLQQLMSFHQNRIILYVNFSDWKCSYFLGTEDFENLLDIDPDYNMFSEQNFDLQLGIAYGTQERSNYLTVTEYTKLYEL